MELESRLYDCVLVSDSHLLSQLLVTPGIDPNWRNAGYYSWTPLHVACSKYARGHLGVIRQLLSCPQIEVNCVSRDSMTPLAIACESGLLEVIEVLLRDPRVNVNLADDQSMTPLWKAVSDNQGDVVRRLLASRHRIDVHLRGKVFPSGAEVSPLEVGEARGHLELVELLRRFISDEDLTRHELRVELGFPEARSVELCALIVLLCDDYLVVRGNGGEAGGEGSSPETTRRFFAMVTRLPLELQKILCLRAFGSTRSGIRCKQSELGFCCILRKFAME